MEQEINKDIPQDHSEIDDHKHRLEKMRKLLLEEEFSEIQNQFENSLKFERETMIQNLAEKDLQSEESYREFSNLISTLSMRIDVMETEIKYLKQNKIDIQELANVLSDLSLQLSNISKTDKD